MNAWKQLPHRALSAIAQDIRQNWNKPYFGAVPYIQAMLTLNSPLEHYGCDSGMSIVNYFLGNAQTWKGETAKKIKQELKDMLKAYSTR